MRRAETHPAFEDQIPGVRSERPALFPPNSTLLLAAEKTALPPLDAEQGCWGLAAHHRITE